MPLLPRAAAPALLLLVVAASPVVAQDPDPHIAVTVAPEGCDPIALTVPAGAFVLEITNAGGDVGEFEVLDGDRVVDEAENLLPGFTQDIAMRMDGGEYQTVCFSLTSPRGTLSVTGGAAATAPPSTVVDAAVLAGYQQTYAMWIQGRAADLVTAVTAFAATIHARDLDAARAAYPTVRIPWEEIEPVAERFADLDRAIDAREEDFAGGVDDPAFTGFHRLERLLWVDGASGDLDALADGLVANVTELASRLATPDIDPRLMARGAGELIDEVAQSKLTGEEDRYSHTDLWSIRANLDGSRMIVDLFRPTLEQVAPDRLAQIDAGFAAVDEVMARYAEGDRFKPFSDITPDDLSLLQARMAGLSESLSLLPGVLGLVA